MPIALAQTDGTIRAERVVLQKRQHFILTVSVWPEMLFAVLAPLGHMAWKGVQGRLRGDFREVLSKEAQDPNGHGPRAPFTDLCGYVGSCLGRGFHACVAQIRKPNYQA